MRKRDKTGSWNLILEISLLTECHQRIKGQIKQNIAMLQCKGTC